MDRSLKRVLTHFRGLLWRKCPKRIPRTGGDSSTSSKVWRCEETLGRGDYILHQWTREAKTVGVGKWGAISVQSRSAARGRHYRRPCCGRPSTVPAGTTRGGNDRICILALTRYFEVVAAIASRTKSNRVLRQQEQPRSRMRGSTPSETNERLRLNLAACSTTLQVLRESARRRTDLRAGRVLPLSPCC